VAFADVVQRARALLDVEMMPINHWPVSTIGLPNVLVRSAAATSRAVFLRVDADGNGAGSVAISKGRTAAAPVCKCDVLQLTSS
jgi:hypothetical protein